LLSRWAFNQMLIGVATRKYARSVRLPDGDLAGHARRATTKSSVSRRFVALSTAKLKEWLAADLSGLDLLVIQIDGLHVGDHLLVAAISIDGAGDKHVLALALGATENAAVADPVRLIFLSPFFPHSPVVSFHNSAVDQIQVVGRLRCQSVVREQRLSD
jgi:hypothetical protein